MNSATPSTVTSKIYNSLVHGRGTAKEAAIKMIDNPKQEFDGDQLRILICNALLNKYLPPAKEQVEDVDNKDIRCWLLSALGRIGQGDPQCQEILKQHLNPEYELDYWVRYWTFEGLIAGKSPDLPDLAKQALERDPKSLIKTVCRAILAFNGDLDSLQVLKQQLGDKEHKWETLRALRLQPIQNSELISMMCTIVEKNEEGTYDSIISLGGTPKVSPLAEDAARTLAKYIRINIWPMYTINRLNALIGLGKLSIEWTASILIDELTDESPAIVCEAARALEKVLGIKTAVVRLVDTASDSTPDQLPKYANALRWMDRRAVVNELEILMSSSIETQQKTARELMQEIGGALAYQKLYTRTNAVNQYLKALEDEGEKVRQLFERTINEARGGFKVAMLMDILVFLIGLSLITASAGLILWRGGSLDSWAGVGMSGGLGVLGVLYSILIARPRRQVRESVDHLMNLKVVFLAYLRQLHQADQAYTKRLMDNELINTEELGNFTKMVGTTMTEAIGQLIKCNDQSPAVPKIPDQITPGLTVDQQVAENNESI